MELKKASIIADGVLAFMLAAIAVSFNILLSNLWLLIFMVPVYIVINVFSGITNHDAETPRLRLLYHGALVVCMVLIASVVSAAVHTVWYLVVGEITDPLLYSLIFSVIVLAVPFFNGILFMYITSVQLRLQWRFFGIIFGLVVPINLFVLGKMLEKCFEEVRFESEKIRLNKARAEEKICQTKYPILLLHGIFFRDMNLFRHWGRMPKEVELNGGRIFYGNNNSAVPVSKSAEEVARRIRDIVASTGSPKVNVIAYSKGGLDIRYAIEHLGIAPMVASVVTVSSPHKGCQFLEFLLRIVPLWIQKPASKIYNGLYKILGDTEVDVLGALHDLTPDICCLRDEYVMPEGIYTRSLGSIMRRTLHGRFPMTLTDLFARRIDGKGGKLCDGITSIDRYEFGDRFTVVMPSGGRGISHGDLIDLHRENIKGFDVREFYVEIVADLKAQGL